jgi:hypothetical protein
MKYQWVKLCSNLWQLKMSLSLILLVGLTINQAYAAFEIKKHTINSGGSEINSASFKLVGSFGQVDATNTLNSANYSLNGGFWNKAVVTPIDNTIFANGFE